MKNLFDYLDYRQFLKDFYEYKKSSSPFFSYRYLGNRVGMNYSFLIKVLQGQMHISNKKIELFAVACDFSKQEADYFHSLVCFNKARTQKDANIHYEKLMSFKEVESTTLDESKFEFFAEWYYPVIWSYLSRHNFRGGGKELASLLNPEITAEQAERAIELLTSIDLIYRNEDGRFSVRELNLSTGSKWYSGKIREYQETLIQLGKLALKNVDSAHLSFSTLTMNIPASAMVEVETLTKHYVEAMKKLSNSYQGAESVYQLICLCFPFTKVGRVK